MTAEVAVLNKIGVALAADSAVTIGRDANKIYTSADKLFQLSNSNPVAIMVYGSATFIGIPWETIIKVYRRQLGNTSFSKIVDYASDFHNFLGGSNPMFDRRRESNCIKMLIGTLYVSVRENAKGAIDAAVQKKGDGLTLQEIKSIFENVVNARLEEIRSRDYIPGFNELDAKKARRRYQKQIRELKKFVFETTPLSRSTIMNLSSIAVETLVRDYCGPFLGGIVIAGFGDDEYFPTLYSFEIEEMAMDKCRWVPRQEIVISDQNAASVNPFAQQEMVHSFMQGIDSGLRDYMVGSTSSLMKTVVETIVEFIKSSNKALGDSLENALGSNTTTLVNNLFEDWGKQTTKYWSPVVQNVAILPKDELAQMAESMVNLTKFRRRVSTDKETVGGPIDVAVVTKGDGFVWVKRKHYFESELNPRIMSQLSKA